MLNLYKNCDREVNEMEVIDIVDNEDGSATMNVNFEEGEVQMLLSFAVVEILKQGIAESEKIQGGDELADL